MSRTPIVRALAVVAGLAAISSVASAADGAKPEFGGYCAYGLARSMPVMTKCETKWEDPDTNKIYCFLDESNKAAFAKDVRGNLAKAKAEYAKLSAKPTAPAAHSAPHMSQLEFDGHSAQKTAGSAASVGQASANGLQKTGDAMNKMHAQ